METFLETADGHKIRYIKDNNGQAPVVLFLSGYRADSTSTKAMFLRAFCAKRNINFVTFEYFGHGQSSGDFEQGTISRWLQDSELVLTKLTAGKVILVGSSMGGYMMCLLARKYPSRIKALLGIAPACDFVDLLMIQKLTEVAKTELQNLGYFNVTAEYTSRPYRVYQQFLDDAKQHSIYQHPFVVDVPIKILHGTKDEVVPWEMSKDLLDHVETKDAELILVKDGNHRLQGICDLMRLKNALLEVLV